MTRSCYVAGVPIVKLCQLVADDMTDSTMPLRSTLLNQGKFEAECSITQRNYFAMLCGEAPCEAFARFRLRTSSANQSAYLKSFTTITPVKRVTCHLCVGRHQSRRLTAGQHQLGEGTLRALQSRFDRRGTAGKRRTTAAIHAGGSIYMPPDQSTNAIRQTALRRGRRSASDRLDASSAGPGSGHSRLAYPCRRTCPSIQNATPLHPA